MISALYTFTSKVQFLDWKPYSKAEAKATVAHFASLALDRQESLWRPWLLGEASSCLRSETSRQKGIGASTALRCPGRSCRVHVPTRRRLRWQLGHLPSTSLRRGTPVIVVPLTLPQLHRKKIASPQARLQSPQSTLQPLRWNSKLLLHMPSQ